MLSERVRRTASRMTRTLSRLCDWRRHVDRGSRAFLVTRGEVVQRLVEELADPRAEIVQAVEVQRQHVVAFGTGKRRVDETVVADVAAQVLLDDDDRVDQLAQRNALIEPPAAPFRELPARLFRSRIADPVAEMMQQLKDALLEILPAD